MTTNKLTIKHLNPVEPPPFKWIKDYTGEIVGVETYERMTLKEFKRRYPDHQPKDL